MAQSRQSTLLLLFVFVLIPCVQVAKRGSKDDIKNVSEYKELKKIFRTSNNVLVICAKSEKSVPDWSLFAQVAVEVRGRAVLVFLDCGENKKLCKKIKVSPTGVDLKHYHEGEYNKDYDRKFTIKSLLNFLRDPKGDVPWEEDATAADVLHIDNKQGMQKLLTKEKKPVLIMFYAPWCGYCKKLKPDYALAATVLKDESVLAGMDVDRQENMAVRQEFNITGFPTILYFERGVFLYKFGGENSKDGLITWMRDPGPPKEPEKEQEWSDVESDVVHLTEETFDSFIETNPSVMLMFYAPWCGHCKTMKPEYMTAATELKDKEITGVLAAIDATKEKALADKFDVKGFPSVKYFKDGEESWEFNGRTADKIVEFMTDPKEPAAPPPAEASWEDVDSQVIHLDSANFKSFLKKKKHTLIMFYAPWCGHCKKAKPEFMGAAEKFKEDSKVVFAGMDCTAHSDVCLEHEVTGYPTFKYFNYGKNSQKYTGGREEADFTNFMTDPQNPSSSLPSPPAPPSVQWAETPGNENVQHFTDSNFDTQMKLYDSALVMFYAPWCGHCQQMKPAYAEAASLLKESGERGVLAALDATAERKISSRFEIKGYPSLKYFKNGELQFDYTKGRSVKELVSFMKHPIPPPPPPPPEPVWSEEPSNVNHLTEDSFNDFISSKANVLVMFYAPWCGHCKNAKPEYTAAAAEMSESTEQFLAAVDCTVHKDLCTSNDIKGYPAFLQYRDGDFVGKYQGGRKKEGFLNFPSGPEPLAEKPKDTPEPDTDQPTDEPGTEQPTEEPVEKPKKSAGDVKVEL